MLDIFKTFMEEELSKEEFNPYTKSFIIRRAASTSWPFRPNGEELIIVLNTFKYKLIIDDGELKCRSGSNAPNTNGNLYYYERSIALADPECFSKLITMFTTDLEYWKNMKKY